MYAVFVIFVLLYCRSYALQCMDHNNNPVDWYVLYKLPKEDHHPNRLISEGVAYTYITSNDISDWKLSSISIGDANSIVGLTLKPLFTEKNNVYILYNDENPDGSVNFNKGHTKGVLLGNNNGGIWLVHSVPRFPSLDAHHYVYPANGMTYGQSFLCISLGVENLDLVGTQLLYNLPNMFAHNMPDTLKWMFPKIANVLENNSNKSPPWYHLQTLRSLGGTEFTSFAKGPKFAKELYLDWVAPVIGYDLFAETWLNSPGKIPSECEIHFKVNNVESLKIAAANVSFKASVDHSKWAVASTSKENAFWVCIGDINRVTAQRQRGGGTVCFSEAKVAKAYQEIIAQLEPCST
ncbi:plancitoxin-1 [Photinus pyralis]|uniref:Uncharacterized protein n=1 Tax=Photinus pyralis TaxID=7054 RepID=A0A1Y1KIE0_PHOPY|nr:plancitoxin-1 [Photinus pyralis]